MDCAQCADQMSVSSCADQMSVDQIDLLGSAGRNWGAHSNQLMLNVMDQHKFEEI